MLPAALIAARCDVHSVRLPSPTRPTETPKTVLAKSKKGQK
jgi:hypothetical protein